jgi:hypothetical protein
MNTGDAQHLSTTASPDFFGLRRTERDRGEIAVPTIN